MEHQNTMEPNPDSNYHQITPVEHTPVSLPNTLKSELSETGSIQPVPVVKVLSPVGVEYLFLTCTLFIGAGSLIGVLLSLVNGESGFSALSFPVSALLVTFPLFAVIFIHLKKMELRNPALRQDPSKRRSTQFTQVISFLISLFTVIGFVFTAISQAGGDSSISVGKVALDCLSILVVSGGILWYYWRDEHRTER